MAVDECEYSPCCNRSRTLKRKHLFQYLLFEATQGSEERVRRALVSCRGYDVNVAEFVSVILRIEVGRLKNEESREALLRQDKILL